MNKLLVALLIAATLVVSSAAWAQPFSVGIVAGVPLTDGLSNVTQPAVDLISRTYSDSKLYIIGAMAEVRLPLGIAIEADGLYRPINSSMSLQILPGPVYHYSENVATWEFPILAKYRFPLPGVKTFAKPFVELGPSFRTTGHGLSWLSGKGFTAGAGVELKAFKFRIAPELRYTHWGSDAPPSPAVGFLPPSNQDQAEFLVGFSF
jgi:hypothetical protein